MTWVPPPFKKYKGTTGSALPGAGILSPEQTNKITQIEMRMKNPVYEQAINRLIPQAEAMANLHAGGDNQYHAQLFTSAMNHLAREAGLRNI